MTQLETIADENVSSLAARAIGLCCLTVDPSGTSVDMKSVDELLRQTFNLTEVEADEWFVAAVNEGFVSVGPDRAVH